MEEEEEEEGGVHGGKRTISTHSLRMPEMMPATSRMAVMMLYSCSQIICSSVRDLPGVTTFWPYRSSRAAASGLDRPSAVLSTSASASPGVRACHTVAACPVP